MTNTTPPPAIGQLTILERRPGIGQELIARLRAGAAAGDPVRFRRDLMRLGLAIGYELSATLEYQTVGVSTPLGEARAQRLSRAPVIAAVLRAGLPMQEGVAAWFDEAELAFVGAARQEGPGLPPDEGPEQMPRIVLGYHASPTLEGRTLILCDPMLATGQSMVGALALLEDHYGRPARVHVAAAVGSEAGLALLAARYPQAHIWLGALDPELDHRAYIVPGLGDAGDLAYGPKA